VLLVPAYAVVVAAPSGPDQGCPTPRQITDALMARIPAVVVSGSEASTPGVLRLSVSGGTGASPLRIEMTDQGGEARLYRNLTVAERGNSDCPALAETVALIVDRYLHDLGYEAPPTLPAPLRPSPADNLTRGPPSLPAGASRFDVFAGGSWRGAAAEESDFEVGIGLGFERGLWGRRLSATITGGVSSTRTAGTPVTNGTSFATVQRMPFRVGLFVPLPWGPGQLEPGVRLGVDRLVATLGDGQTDTQIGPRAELALCYRVTMLRRLFVRGGISGGVGVGDRWTRKDGTTEIVEPQVYFKSGLELGFSFQ
jgi:hypothetical protein